MKYLIYFIISLWSITALAHKPSDSYLTVNIEDKHVTGRWDIALRDLDFAIGLDNNDDGAITWGELRANIPDVSGYAFSRLQLGVSDEKCVVQQRDVKVDTHIDGKYAVLFFAADCGDKTGVNAIDKLVVSYRLFHDLDPQHRGLLKLNRNDKNAAAVLVPGQPARTFTFSSNDNPGTNILDFIHEGIWHIWIGFDHILFLLSLLIPSVMVYNKTKWLPVTSFNTAFWDVVKVVSAFTLAHSLTLSMAVLGYAELPSRWVESVIAASVILAALNNLVPVFTTKRALLAFCFGLIHGFGFASVLADLGLQTSLKLWGLLGFNLGVEIGQLTLVLVFLPISYKLSRFSLYQLFVVRFCSMGIAGIGSIWLVERLFDVQFLTV